MAAAAFGALAAYRLVRPLRELGSATREIARGRHAVPLPRPRDRELAELADDVTTLANALARTESRRVRLLGEVAHELRTPLTVARASVEGMIDGVLPADAGELGRLEAELRRLERLVADLSELARAEEGRLVYRPRAVDLGRVVADAAERLRTQAVDAGVGLSLDLPDDGVPARVDPDRIAQVVTNLVGNAIRATAPPGEVAVTLRREGPEAVLTVADTGEGLDEADLERVFERFYRVPGRRGGHRDGSSGIGLTIARGIVRRHGGELVARSAGRGRGATFTARLPLAPDQEPDPEVSA